MGLKDKLATLRKSKSENTLAFFNLLGPIVLNGINFFTVPVFTRLLGTENYGIVSVYTAWVSILAIVIGLQTSGTVAVARVHLAPDEQKRYRSSVLSLSMLSMVIISILMVIFIGPVSKFLDLSATMVIIMVLQGFGTYVISFTTITFTYDKKAQKNFLLSIITAIAIVTLSIVLILMAGEGEGRAYARIWGMAVPNIVIGAIFFTVFSCPGQNHVFKGVLEILLAARIAADISWPVAYHFVAGRQDYASEDSEL